MADDYEWQDVLASMPGQRVLIVGDVILDEYVVGEPTRLSAEAPVPVLDYCAQLFAPGGAANAAANVASLHGMVALGGVIGDDHCGGRLRAELTMRAISVDGLHVDDSRPTTTKTRVVAHGHQLVRIDRESRAQVPLATEDALLGWVAREMASTRACIISDYAKGVVTPRLAQETLRLAKSYGTPVVVDPKSTNHAIFRGATVIKPNRQELAKFVGADAALTEKAQVMDAAQRLALDLPGTSVLVTLGARGMLLLQCEKEPKWIPSVARVVFDVTGAGDTVTAVLATALAAGCELERAAWLANAAAGVVVGKSGTGAVTLAELSDAVAIAANQRAY